MTEDNGDAETVPPAEHRVERIASGYLKRRFSLIVYPALLNAGSAIVVLLICYGLGTAVVALVTFRRKNNAPRRGDLASRPGHFLHDRTWFDCLSTLAMQGLHAGLTRRR